MPLLDRVIPTPALVEVDGIDLGVAPAQAWEFLRHGDLGDSPLVRALFATRMGAPRDGARPAAETLRIDELCSSARAPGFQVLADDGRSQVVVGAIGKVWHLQIPFVHVADAEAFRAFADPGFVKVAWSIRLLPRGEGCHIAVELRVDATDPDAWGKFRRYFALIGPATQFVRRSLLASLARRFGTAESKEGERPLAGDEVLPDASSQLTQGVTIPSPPEAIWPWLVQLQPGPGGFGGLEALDAAARATDARARTAEVSAPRVGDVLHATPNGDDGFEVLAVEPGRLLVLGTLYDADGKRQRSFAAARPEHYWQMTWSFVLEPLDAATTRLHVRARAAFSSSSQLHIEWIRPMHPLLHTSELARLAAAAEGRLRKDDWRDVLKGMGGAAILAAAFLTPFQRDDRSRWGLAPEDANRAYPGDELVTTPRWTWTHGVEIDAPSTEVWPWVAQLGAERVGFYSYQGLENVAGGKLRPAELASAHGTVSEGDVLRLHPKMPPLRVARVERGTFLVAHAPADPEARSTGKPWAEVSWLFFIEPLGPARSRLVSRYRCATSDDVATRLSLGCTVLEPVSFAMDRRMLLGVKSRVERGGTKKSLRGLARRRAASQN